jgi:2-keto-3-deoxy-L-rhamnonate aldolase RhmA
LRVAAAAARVAHVDVLVKTSERTRMAEVCDLPVAGFVLSDCDTSVLREVADTLGPRGNARPFVMAVVETMRAVEEMEAIARSPWVDALVVGDGDLGRRARLAGVDPSDTVAHAHRSLRRVATREGKWLAVVAQSAAQERRARSKGAAVVLRGTDHTIIADGIRSLVPIGARRSRDVLRRSSSGSR